MPGRGPCASRVPQGARLLIAAELNAGRGDPFTWQRWRRWGLETLNTASRRGLGGRLEISAGSAASNAKRGGTALRRAWPAKKKIFTAAAARACWPGARGPETLRGERAPLQRQPVMLPGAGSVGALETRRGTDGPSATPGPRTKPLQTKIDGLTDP
ncbi:hypothetical protein NDU88_002875 [Pleurodeles waltl]|uniref:Uncharacterized protein n=1 Tax=Pleurodeles waltl TaxID=8319 RepID=A0AAV7PC50_PLEWA|nr:hypothetical protein NDU88_002875 [Pleurodeles waltl]